MDLKKNQFSQNNYLKGRTFAVLIFSNMVKLDNFRINFTLKVSLSKLLLSKEVFETHLQKLIKH